MYQIGNLAIICAERPDIALEISGHAAVISAGYGTDWRHFSFNALDNSEVNNVIYELNHGSLRRTEAGNG